MDMTLIEDQEGNYVGRAWSCGCGATVESYLGHDVECDSCGQLYNASGRALRHYSQWDERDDY